MPSSLKKFWRHRNYSFSSISAPKKLERSLDLLGKIQRLKIRKASKLETAEWHTSEQQGLEPIHKKLTRKRLNGRRYKELLRLSALKAKASAHEILRRDLLSEEGGEVTDSNGSKKVDESVAESISLCSEGQRVDFSLTQEVCNVESEHECSQSSSVDERKGEARDSMELRDEHAYDKEFVKSQPEIEKESHCAICLQGGKLLCCSGQGCRKSFHLSCVDPPLTFAPPGIWHCSWCTRKKIKFGVHSVSEGIESILDCREVVSNNEVIPKQKEYLVKYKSLAHVHNRWIPETQLRLEAPMLFERYKGKKIKWKAEWRVPHRLLKRRLLISLEPRHGYDGKDSDCAYEWLVKWTGLEYDHATWELANASFLTSPQAMMLIRNFESQQQNFNAASHHSMEDEVMKITPVQLSEFPFEVSPEVHNCQLTYVNKLRGYWSRGQNAVIFDEDRIVKVVLFVLSLQSDTSRPFLIITSSNTISLWEAEFSRFSSSSNVVVYNGNRDNRAIIRTLEFYDEGGCVSFRVLLSPPDAIVEDMEMLDHIKWEAMVIDECQRPVISVHLMQIKMLAADMKLLLVSGKVLRNEDAEMDPNIDTRKLKERLAQFTAFECKFGTSKFSEYWVPARLSRMQIEQCRDLLLSNSRLLCSSLRNDAVDSLREILSLTQKCCDHPYLVDHSLRSRATRGLPPNDHLDAEINVSSKLQLLDKILSEVKKRSLKVLVLFQSLVASGEISIGDILDDLVHRRFGEDSYVRIQGEMAPPRRQSALDMFNNKESTSFICLIDYRACISSIKLSSLGIVILFNSDLNPLNDLRALQKITIDSQFEQIKVFRLYSCFTIEEKALILAKLGAIFDSRIQRINRSSCHMLLTWGGSYLFNKLNDFDSHISSGKSFLDDVLSELWAQLPDAGDDGIAGDCSIISNVGQMEGTYPSNIMLLGEVEDRSTDVVDNEAPHLFWRNLLDEKPHHNWKHLSMPSRRTHKKAQSSGNWYEGSESENVTNKCKKVVNSTISKMRSRNKQKLLADVKGYKLMGAPEHSADKRSKRLPNPNSPTDTSSRPRVPRIVSMQYVGRDDATSNGHVTEIEQHERAIQMNVEMPNNGSANTNMVQPKAVARPVSSCQSHNLPNYGIPTSSGAQVQEDPPLEDSAEPSTAQPILPLPLQPSACLHVGRSVSAASHLRNTNIEPESRNCHPLLSVAAEVAQSAGTDPLQREMEESRNSHPLPSEAAEVAQSAGTDPLQREMERIQKDIDEVTKIHQETESRLNLECEKEIAEMRKKYDALIQESEMGLVKQMEILERKYKIVYNSKLLAEALAQKCHTSNAAVSVSKGTEQVTISSFMDEISQLYFQPILASSQMADPPVMSVVQSVNHSSTSQSGWDTSSRDSSIIPIVADIQQETPLLPVVNNPSCRAPRISAVGPQSLLIPAARPLESSFAGSIFRALAPHLRNSRTLSSVTLLPDLPTSHPMPSIHESPANPSFTSSMSTQATPRPNEMQSGNVGNLPEVHCSLSSPNLPSGSYRLPPLDLPNLFSLQYLGSNYRAI